MKCKFFKGRLFTFTVCFFAFVGSASMATAGTVYIYFHDDGTNSTIETFGSLDFSGVPTFPDQSLAAARSFSIGHDDTIEIGSSTPTTVRGFNLSTVNIRTSGIDNYDGKSQVTPTSYSSNFYFLADLENENLFVDRDNIDGGIADFTCGKVTFAGDLATVVGEDIFTIGLTAGSESVYLTTTEPSTAPDFCSLTVPDQHFRQNRTVNLQLPAAYIGGNGLLHYSLTPLLPGGLEFDPDTRKITGTAEVLMIETEYTLRVVDSDSDSTSSDADTLTFKIKVSEPPPVDEALIETSVQQTLSETAGIVGGVTMSGIRSRVQNFSAPRVPGSASLNLNDREQLQLGASKEPIRMNAEEFLYSSKFPALLNAYGEGGGLGGRSFSAWSEIAHNRFDNDGNALNFDGEISGISFGLDTPIGEGVVGGVALSRFSGKTEYQQSNGNSGKQKVKATSISPYFGLRTPEYTLWTFVGIGSGDFRLDQDSISESSDLSLSTVGVGASTQVWSSSDTTMHLTGDFALTKMSVDASSGFIPAQDSSLSRTRLVLEASQRRQMPEGGTVEPSVEFGVSHDSGDGASGSRLEVGAGLNYLSASQRMTLTLSSYGLVKRNNSSEWGVQGSIRMQPGNGEQGMSFSLKPSYGAAVRGVDRIWNIGRTDDVAEEDSYRLRLDAGVSYGIRIIGDRALLTPFSELSLAGGDRTYRIGTRFRHDSNLELSLIGATMESENDTDKSIRIQAGVQF